MDFKFPTPQDTLQASTKALEEKGNREKQLSDEVWEYYKERCANTILEASARGDTKATFDLRDFEGKFRGGIINEASPVKRLTICGDKMRELGYKVTIDPTQDTYDMLVSWAPVPTKINPEKVFQNFLGEYTTQK